MSGGCLCHTDNRAGERQTLPPNYGLSHPTGSVVICNIVPIHRDWKGNIWEQLLKINNKLLLLVYTYSSILVYTYKYIYLGQFASHDIKLCSDAMHKCAEGLIMTILTGRGPRSPGSIEFLFLIWTGYFNLGSSWLSKEGTWLHIKVQRQGEDIKYVLKL